MNTTHKIIGPAEDYKPTQKKAEILYTRILIRKHNFVKLISQFLRFIIRAAQYQTHLAFNTGCTAEVQVKCELHSVAYLSTANYPASGNRSRLYL